LVRSRSDSSYIRLVEALKLTNEDTVLEVGCGTGIFALSLAGHAAHVTGLDLTPEMLAQARALQAELNIANVSWQQGDALPLPFAAGTFSIVVSKATFHHFIDPAAVLSQMARVAAPGARLSVSDMTFEPAQGVTFDRIEKLRDPSHVRVLAAEELRGLGSAAGLSEVGFWQTSTPLPFEAVLATSFPEPGNLERVREFYRADAASGEDRLGLKAHEENGQVVVSYPMTTVVWEKR
jgi:SAM-dependent methyltransferase